MGYVRHVNKPPKANSKTSIPGGAPSPTGWDRPLRVQAVSVAWGSCAGSSGPGSQAWTACGGKTSGLFWSWEIKMHRVFSHWQFKSLGYFSLPCCSSICSTNSPRLVFLLLLLFPTLLLCICRASVCLQILSFFMTSCAFNFVLLPFLPSPSPPKRTSLHSFRLNLNLFTAFLGACFS